MLGLLNLVGWILTIGLIAGGALAASSIIAKKSPEAGEAIKKLAPFQGIIGIVLGLAGLIFVILIIINIRIFFGFMLPAMPVVTILVIASAVIGLALGILLAINLLKANPNIPKDKLEALEKKLAPKQIPLGIIGLCLGVFLLLNRVIGFGF